MVFGRNKTKGIKLPSGKDAVNFRKVLFLPLQESKDALATEQWQRVSTVLVSIKNNMMIE